MFKHPLDLLQEVWSKIMWKVAWELSLSLEMIWKFYGILYSSGYTNRTSEDRYYGYGKDYETMFDNWCCVSPRL